MKIKLSVIVSGESLLWDKDTNVLTIHVDKWSVSIVYLPRLKPQVCLPNLEDK